MWNLLQAHSEPRQSWAWRCTQLGLILLPLIPVFGALLLVASSIRSTYDNGARLWARPLNRGFALLGGLMLGMSFWAEDRGEALLGLVHFLPYFWLLAAQTELTGQPRQLRQLARIVALSAVPLVIIVLGELSGGWSAPPLLGGILPWPVNAFGTPPGRMSSLFSYANNLALYLTVAFVFALGLWCAHWRSPRSTGLLRSKPLMLWSGVLCLSAVGIILTQSRSAWGLMALSALAAAVYLRWTWVVGAVAGFAGAVGWAAFVPLGQASLRQIIPRFLWARLSDQNFPDRPLPTLRLTQWRFTLDLIRQRPLQGWGLRNFTPLYEIHTQVWMGHPHNLFLMLGAEMGLPLTAGLIGLIGWILVRASDYFCFHYFVVDGKDVAAGKNLARTNQLKTASHCIFGAFLLAFANITLFHGFDVLFFDFRINAIAWTIVSQILGEFYLSSVGNLSLRRSGSPESV